MTPGPQSGEDDDLPAEPGRRLERVAVLALLGLLARAVQEVRRLRAELVALRQHSEALADDLRSQARTDPLTGLGNRRQWEEQLAHELDRARRTGAPLAVAVVDVDDFKAVNDARGHTAGDELLRRLASGFLPAVRSVDLVARTGGDEFAVALPDASPDAAARIIDRLRASAPPSITCSAGLAIWDGHESAEALYARADAAMYRAKKAGRTPPEPG